MRMHFVLFDTKHTWKEINQHIWQLLLVSLKRNLKLFLGNYLDSSFILDVYIFLL